VDRQNPPPELEHELPNASSLGQLPGAPALRFPHQVPPAPGEVIEIAEGILWAQFPLPFALNHVNVYLLRDGDGWAVVDTGIGDERTYSLWRTLVEGPLRNERLTKLIVTHFHPDHIGAGSWLIGEYGPALHMSRSEYLYNLVLHRSDTDVIETYRRFYELRGLAADRTTAILKAGHDYVDRTSPMPPVYHCLADGDTLAIGDFQFEVLTGGGHSWEQVMLFERRLGLFIVADQVLPRISTNVSVVALEPDNDPLGVYLASISRLRRDIPENVLALPGHRLPYLGMHGRIAELLSHHEDRCREIVEACHARPMTPAELVPILFFDNMDTQQTSFAFCEIVAHINYMKLRGQMHEVRENGLLRYSAGG
jgi:glyoxylase-like metal-dependent hydrolase (beta-lactamase superfamily II)